MAIVQFCLRNPLLLNLLTVLIATIGAVKAWQMNKEAFPAVNFDVVSVRTVYPGASPNEVELYVTDPIEDEVRTVDGLDRVTSTSIEGLSIVLAYLDPDRSEEDKIRTTNDIQRAVDRVNTLPDEVPNPPIIRNVDSGDMPVIEIGLWGDVTYAELHKHADDLKRLLEDVPDVQDVVLSGYREREFWIEVDPNKLRRYSMGLEFVLAKLAARNINLPGGVLKSESGDILVRTVGELTTTEALENIVLRSNDAGIAVRLKDIGKAIDTFEEEKTIYRTNEARSINLQVTKKASGDIIRAVDQAKVVTEDYLQFDPRLRATYMTDVSFFVRNRLGVLLDNSIVGIVLVVIALLLFLSRGIAIVTAVGMPIAFLGTLMIMGYMGMSINLISMFGLVIVLGMLVDDAIIVAENIWQYYEAGETPWDAAVKGASEVFWPVTATILTSIAAFSPLMMISGIFGKFITFLPQVVIIALGVSLIEAMFILPSHAYDVLKFSAARHARRQARSEKEIHRVKQSKSRKWLLTGYEYCLYGIIKMRYLFLAAMVCVLAFSVWFAQNKMKLILFPSDGVESFFVRATTDSQNSLTATLERFKSLEAIIKSLPSEELQDFNTQVGIQRDDPQDPFAKRGSNVGQIVVFLTPEKDRNRTADEIIEDLRPKLQREAPELGLKEVYFSRMRTGPPVGKPVSLRLKGDSFLELDKASAKLQERLTAMPGVLDITRNYEAGKDELRIQIDEKSAAQALLTVRDIALHVRTAIEGQIATYVHDGGDRVAVRVRYPERDRREVESITESQVANAAGLLVPLNRVANFDQVGGLDAIFHRNYRRTVTVSAAVDEKLTTSSEVNLSLVPDLETLRAEFPGIIIEPGGEYEDTEESLNSLLEAFVIALLLIYIILATLFRHLTLPFIVMSAIPFGIVGVIIAFYIHDLPLSFLGMIGAIGLAGVVVNDSIVLVDFTHNASKNGLSALDAAIHAGKRRFRAVWLTTLTTVLGLLPLVYSFGGEDKFLRPAATALAYGLVFATVLILLLIPAVYVIHEDLMRGLRYLARPFVGKPEEKVL